jgi:hypothetical protein
VELLPREKVLREKGSDLIQQLMAARFVTTVIVAIALAQCPLIGSNPEELDLSERPPVYPGERTFSGFVGMSQRGPRAELAQIYSITSSARATPALNGHRKPSSS